MWQWEYLGVGFEWPWALLLLLLLPFLVQGYINAQRRRWKNAFRFSHAATVERLQHEPSGWRRLVLPITTLMVVTLLMISLARPVAIVRVPTHALDMMLTLDISISMLAEDMEPNRMTAAKEAAIRFVKSLPKDVRIGLQFFAGNTYLVSKPTADHDRVADLLKSLKKEDLEPYTAIGSAVQRGLKALQDVQSDRGTEESSLSEEAVQQPSEASGDGQAQKVMVLLSDGQSTVGYPWDRAADHAKEQNVVVYTVGIGGQEPTSIVYQGDTYPVFFDETTLKDLAKATGGEYFRAFTKTDFKTIYDQVTERALIYEKKTESLGFILAALALALILAAGWLHYGGVRSKTGRSVVPKTPAPIH